MSESFRVNSKRCKEDFVVYDDVREWFKKGTKKTPRAWTIRTGIKADDPNYVHLQTKYNNFEKKKTKVRKNWISKKVNLKYREKYGCGTKKSLFTKPFPPEVRRLKSYYIHDNGGRPFLVFVKGQTELHIYRIPSNVVIENYDNLKKNHYNQLVKTYKTKKIWIGNQKTKDCCDGWNPRNSRGNSILAHLGKNKYLWIGIQINEFETPQNDVIEKYFSMIGNNDVPYPVALGKKFVYYDGISYLPRTAFKDWKMTDADWELSHGIYYDHDEARKLSANVKAKKVPKYKIIQKRL